MDHGSWVSLIPFLLVIPISIWTKQVQPALFVSLLVGSFLVEPSIMGGVKKFLSYITSTTVQSSNIRIIIFLYGFAGLVNLITIAGGIKGFVELVSRKIKTQKGAMVLVWLSTLGTFSDPDFRIVTIGPIMKALKDKLNMSARRIGLVIEITSNPVVALVPIATGFVGYMVGLINTALGHSHINRPAYLTYVESIPFNFFSFAILAVGLYYTFFMHQKHEKTAVDSQADESKRQQSLNSIGTPEMAMAEKKSFMQTHDGDSPINPATGAPDPTLRPAKKKSKNSSDTYDPSLMPQVSNMADQDATGVSDDYQAVNYNEEYARHMDAQDLVKHPEKLEKKKSDKESFDDSLPSRPLNLILPLITVLLLTLFLSWWDGHAKANNFMGAFIKSDALGVMLESLFITLVLSIVFFLIQKIPLTSIVSNFISGGNQLMSVVVLLALIWGVSAVSEDLGFSKFITSHVSWIPSHFVAPILFLLGCLISYFIGSSWGTWGLLMPLGIMVAHNSGANILLVIGAVFASGTFGAFCSPLSDNTVTLCTVLDLPVVDYSRSKLVPALIAVGIATILFTGFSFFL
ncbi:Na+/H+ antiporter NhaC family protein [Pullulanibacillus sp. KACC 23026]|uniref:Na+/H+ antiporter NhaC family protein n=1 Tax=Pullulanibacillus sp. KACC 23026 TaxID=3028315 RepID=UPI0023AF610D|nr:Na+/H+ antiporter NhaC family protein [Pullulanibacillus sp. KACC 23026]WEG14197.1 Na+/H+ antiporter NhaC family protein [Pullulanibacillus sp. KACC 23026]